MPFAERFARHATDSALVAMVAGAPVTPHVTSCASCQARLAGLRDWTTGVAAEAGALADEAFSAPQLAAQKKEILRRLESAGRSARVIAFPLGAPATAVRGTRKMLRWTAAAACAGLFVGLASGRLLEWRADERPASVASAAPALPLSAVVSPRIAELHSLDEAALLDAAYDRISIDALQTIDDLTPRAREAVLASMPRPRR